METNDIEKRLEKIDSKLDSINEYILQTALQQKDIDNLKKEVEELKSEQKEIKAELETTRTQTTKDKAKVFDNIIKYIGMAILGGAVSLLVVGIKTTIAG